MFANVRKVVISALLAVLFCSTALAQLNYSISGGSLSFAPLPAPPPSQLIDLSLYSWSPSIAPAGFTFAFGGQSYSDFRVARFGQIELGGSTGTQEQRISPFNSLSSYGPSTRISWDFQGGVLTVEWLQTLDRTTAAGSMGPAEYSFQTVINTATGIIEFRYAAASGGAFVPKLLDRHVVALRGHFGSPGTGRTVLPGNLPGFVNSDGTVSAWPSDMYLRFSPTGTTRQAPTVVVTRDGVTQIPVAYGTNLYYHVTVQEHGLRITINDADSDMARVDAEIRKVPATVQTPDIPQSSFSSVLTPVPYTLFPLTGVINEGTYEIMLYVTDDLDGVHEFVFFLNWEPESALNDRPSNCFGSGKQGYCCSTSACSGELPLLLVALAIAVVALRLGRARRIES